MENGRNGTLSNGHHDGEEADATEVRSEDNDEEQDRESDSDGEVEPEEGTANDNAKYELDREEPESPSAHDWKLILMKAEFAEELFEQIRKMKPYERRKRTGRIVSTKSLRSLRAGTFMFLDCGTKITYKVIT